MVALSTDSLFARLADADAATILFWIGLLSGTVTSVVVVTRERRTPWAIVRRDGAPLLLAAALQAVMIGCFVASVRNTSIANVAAIIAAAPLGAAALSWLLLRERTEGRVWAAIGVSAIGIAIVISGSVGGGRLEGDLLVLGAVVAYGFSVVLLRRWTTVSRTMVVGLGGYAVAATMAWFATFTGHSAKTWFAFVAMGAVFGPLARIMLSSAPRYLPAAEVALFAPLETALAPLWAYLAFDERPAGSTWLGGAVVLAGVVWAVGPRPAARPVASAQQIGERLAEQRDAPGHMRVRRKVDGEPVDAEVEVGLQLLGDGVRITDDEP
jgi:drug/metabolite transporter (DMT)-like permease